MSDPGCSVSRFEPVVWEYGSVRRLSISVPGTSDTYGLATSINDKGQVAGSSGTCGPFSLPAQSYLVLNHALLWDRDGTPHDLGNLGGSGGLGGNHACAVNNRGQVAGHSMLTGNTVFHGFAWTEATGMVDLGTLPGDAMSLANGLNDAGDAIGASIGPGFSTFTAVIWDAGGIADLNKLVTSNPGGLYLLVANWVSSSGEIVGVGVAADGVHGFLAIPNGGQGRSPVFRTISAPVLDGRTRELIIRRSGIHLP
jgi:probable HAF family extracellular repeat protein